MPDSCRGCNIILNLTRSKPAQNGLKTDRLERSDCKIREATGVQICAVVSVPGVWAASAAEAGPRADAGATPLAATWRHQVSRDRWPCTVYSAVQCCVQYTPGHQSASELSPSGTESPHPVTAVSTRTSAAADVSYVISCARGLVTAARVSHLAPCHVSMATMVSGPVAECKDTSKAESSSMYPPEWWWAERQASGY